MPVVASTEIRAERVRWCDGGRRRKGHRNRRKPGRNSSFSSLILEPSYGFDSSKQIKTCKTIEGTIQSLHKSLNQLQHNYVQNLLLNLLHEILQIEMFIQNLRSPLLR